MPGFSVIFLPGIMGSALELPLPSGGSCRVWDGDLLTVARTLLTEPHVLHATTHLNPPSVIEELTVGPLSYEDTYGSVLNFLRANLKYVDGQTLFLFPYDWRQSIFSTASRLVDFVDQLLPGDTKIVLLAHSMGALVARAAVIGSPRLAGRVEKVIEVAPPHLGSSQAFLRIQEVWALSSLRRILGRYLAAAGVAVFEALVLSLARSMPSLWQLLPLASETILTNITNFADQRSALEWPGWADAVRVMAQTPAEAFHKHSEEIPRKWPASVRTCVVFSRAWQTPYTFLFDASPPYHVHTTNALPVSGDRLVVEWSSVLQYTVRHEVDFQHRIMTRDPKTWSVLSAEL